jgi:hypothetical protein
VESRGTQSLITAIGGFNFHEEKEEQEERSELPLDIL